VQKLPCRFREPDRPLTAAQMEWLPSTTADTEGACVKSWHSFGCV
jgi:hypothetical protein